MRKPPVLSQDRFTYFIKENTTSIQKEEYIFQQKYLNQWKYKNYSHTDLRQNLYPHVMKIIK